MSWSQRYPQINSADIQNRLSRIITVGTVAETDYEKARVKVTVGEWTTGWLPWLTSRASNDVSWWALEVGEQVLVVSPSGDMAQGIVIGGIYQQQQQQLVSDVAADQRQNIHRVKYQDGTVIEYDREKHVLKADVKGDVELLVEKNLTGTVGEDVELTVKGNMTATVSKGAILKADTISLESASDMTLKAGGAMTLEAA
ncbi:MAG: phage baseplate assembly protein V, partial [Psychrosphaera sp.]|nr:phage baseplate assembly protein V [Psychrosphaera sp.]